MMSTTTQFLSKTPLGLRVVSLYVVVAVVAQFNHAIIAPTLPTSQPAIASAVQQSVEPVATILSGTPSRLQVERLGIDLPIIDGQYNQQKNDWTLTDDAVQFATMTTQPNSARGNTFLYGHNTDAVLAKMQDIIPGDTVTVTTSNDHSFSYTYIDDTFVTPDQTNVLQDNPSTPRLTIMTCQGILSETRRLMFFDLSEAV
jgi:LPXTG-site transpeptidase (sortase) family protein